ncbi:unnamed protein product [Effrenium voratum]|nr:unnamed protein product [Effrenium voratum]
MARGKVDLRAVLLELRDAEVCAVPQPVQDQEPQDALREHALSAAKEEIAELRLRLQQAHAELADRAADRFLGSDVPYQEQVRTSRTTPRRLVEMWTGQTSCRSYFQLWHKEAQLSRLQSDHQAELLQRGQELRALRLASEAPPPPPPPARSPPKVRAPVPRALATAWGALGQGLAMLQVLRLWRQYAEDQLRHRQSFELFELRAQLQSLSRRAAQEGASRCEALQLGLATSRLRAKGRLLLCSTLLRWRCAATSSASRRQRFLLHRQQRSRLLVLRVLYCWHGRPDSVQYRSFRGGAEIWSGTCSGCTTLRKLCGTTTSGS